MIVNEKDVGHRTEGGDKKAARRTNDERLPTVILRVLREACHIFGAAAPNAVNWAIMKIVLQRCLSARVEVAGEVVGQIERGFAVFLGIAADDDAQIAAKLAAKIANLRVFSDQNDKFNWSLGDVEGKVLLIPNFTLLGDARKGNRPNFIAAAPPEAANALFQTFATLLREQGVAVETGVFGADMKVWVENDGPVTLLLES